MMEVVPHEGKGLPPLPFQRRNVEEWSRLDSLTGMLEHARVQTDHWAATTCNSSHHFGKVIDSRARNLADGSSEQRQQTKQLEVFQANIPGGSVQVIRSQSLTTSSWQAQTNTTKLSSGSSWSVRANQLKIDEKEDESDFDNLKLAVHPLDLSSQKMKASVGRSGSISSRRPPSRPRSIAGSSKMDKPGQIMEEEEVADGHIVRSNNKLSQMARICQQYHEEAKNHASFQSMLKSSSSSSTKQSSFSNITNGKESLFENERRDPSPASRPVTLSYIFDKNSGYSSTDKKPTLVRKKSCSSEDIRIPEDNDFGKSVGTENGVDWKRSSKARRSLQFPLQAKSEENDIDSLSTQPSNVFKLTKEIETRKQIVANSLKNSQSWNNIETVLNRVIRTNNQSYDNKDNGETNREDELVVKDNNKSLKKKHSFVTVESLKEVRGRLRKMGSPVADDVRYDEEDDGIVTELKNDSPIGESDETSSKSVKSYVYGMEALLRNGSRPTTITGTGSLESRSTNKSSSSSSSRSEEWYNRRKSYGFEQVNGQSVISQESNLYGDKNKVDSSTDSGICRSSETVANIPIWNKPIMANDHVRTSHSITIKRALDKNDDDNNDRVISNSNSEYMEHKGRKTVVTLGVTNRNSSPSWNWNNNQSSKPDEAPAKNIQSISEEPKELVTRGKIADALKSLREKSTSNGFESRRLSEPITISIPVINDDTETVNSNGLLLKQTKEPLINNKYNLNKPLHEDSNHFSTSYSKLLFGNNRSSNIDEDDSVNNGNDNDDNNSSSVRLQISSWNRNSSTLIPKDNEFKRHSIAVDEAKYMDPYNKEKFEIPSIKDKIASFRNHFESKSGGLEKSSFGVKTRDDERLITDYDTDSNANEKKPKKVEFCKTEVHFAAESGRFNIVETDGKPPPNNMFRRRRRTIAEVPARTNTNLPEIRFGDSQYEKNLLTSCEVSELESEEPQTEISLSASLDGRAVENDKNVISNLENPIISFPETEDKYNAKNVDDNLTIIEEISVDDDDDTPRSILKSNFQKQVTTHNETINANIEEIDTHSKINRLSFNLNSLNEDPKSTTKIPWRSTIMLHSSDNSNDSEVKNLLKTMRPAPSKQTPTVIANYNGSVVESSSTAADNGLAVRITSAANLPDQRRASWSVAERVRHVEDLKTRGFSTKVNFGLGETTVVTPELRNSPVHDLLSSSWMMDTTNTSDEVTRSTSPARPNEKTAVHVKINPSHVPNPPLHTNNLVDTNYRASNRKLTHSKSFSVSTSSPNWQRTIAYDDQLNEMKDELRSASLVMRMLNKTVDHELTVNGSNVIKIKNVFNKRDNCSNYNIDIKDDLNQTNNIDFHENTTIVNNNNNSIINRINQFENLKWKMAEERDYLRRSKTAKETINKTKSKEDMLNSLNRMISSNSISNDKISKHSINPIFVDENLNLTTHDALMNASNLKNTTIPEVLNVLDDLSRCIEEVIVEIPKPNKNKTAPKVMANSLTNENVFRIVEDFGKKAVNTRLEALKDLDNGDLSDDSLKADEEVRSYMSAGNDGDESDYDDDDECAANRKRTFKYIDQINEFNGQSDHLKKETVSSTRKPQQHVVTTSSIVPTYTGPTSKVKSVETLVSTRSGNPKITSISLRYTDDDDGDSNIRHDANEQSLYQTEGLQNIKIIKNDPAKISVYSTSSDKIAVNNNNKIHTSIISSYRKDVVDSETNYRNNTSRLSSPQNERPVSYEKLKISDDSDRQKSSQIIINCKARSPSSDSVFLERTSKQHSLYNQLSAPRNRSMSPVPFPTRPVTNLPDYINTRQVHSSSKQIVTPAVSSNSSSVWTSVNKVKKKEISKTDDYIKKKQTEESMLQKEKLQKSLKEKRMLSSSSGRDGWLNAPKGSNSSRQRPTSLQLKKHSSNNAEVDNKEKKMSTPSTLNTINSKYEITKPQPTRQGSESPIYQNREIYKPVTNKEKDPFEGLETESAILEELTRAADQILLAVNGYTDEESIRVSSDDEFRRKHGKERPISKPLSTISETPVKKKTAVAVLKRDSVSKTSGSLTQSSVGASSRTRLCKTSSNSSVEGSAEVKSLFTEERSKRRAARLLQRASSRELLLQNTGASSSEDIASGTETTAPQRSKQRVVRRTAKQYSSRTTTTSHQNSTCASTSRTKDRVQRTGGNAVDERESVSHRVQRRTDDKPKASRVTTTSSSGKTNIPGSATQVTATATTKCERSSRNERRPPERPGGGVGRTRTQHALSKRKTTSSASHKDKVITQANK